VLAARPQEEFRWVGKFVVRGLFDGEHFFELQPDGAKGTRFVHGERFTGVLVGMARASLEGPTRAGFEAMNLALKQRAES
jgi:hypothetical protein